MRLGRAPSILLSVTLVAVALAGCLQAQDAGVGSANAPGEDPMSSLVPPAPSFASPLLLDGTRAGGEPVIAVHPDGTILYSSHAGTTHYNAWEGGVDPDFATPYTTQSFIWRSTDGGATWEYVGLPEANAGPHGPGHGFSDPDFAVDEAGNVYHTELYLAQASVSKSDDAGASWLQGNPAASHWPIVDRQWLAAGEANEVFLSFNQIPTGHMVLRSTDGGLTFPEHTYVDGGAGKIYYDKANDVLYDHDLDDEEGTYAIQVSTDDAASFTRHVIAQDRSLYDGGFADLAIDNAGNVYAVWTETGPGEGTSIWMASSADHGETWTRPSQVSASGGTDMWPWIVAGDAGRVFVTWMHADTTAPPGEADDAEWFVHVAQSLNGNDSAPLWKVTQATPEPFHEGAICQMGTACQWNGGDRRLGDFFTATLDNEGRLLVAYPTTTMDGGEGAISHPAFLKQQGGVSAFSDVGALGEALAWHR